MKKELKKYTDEKAATEKDIKTFDELDFVVFSNQSSRMSKLRICLQG
jgi:hypothetical protein